MAALGIGTATFIPNYNLSEKQGSKQEDPPIARAIDLGIQYIDTAPSYGHAEDAVGACSEQIRSRQVRVCTKGDARRGSDALEEEFSKSLQRLRRDTVDTLLMHSAREETLSSGAVEFFERIKSEGRAGRIGASTYGIDDALSAIGLPWCDVVQIEHSILNPSVLSSISTLRREGQEVVVRSVLCRGLLSSGGSSLPNVPDAVARALDELQEVAQPWGFGLTDLSIRFALDSPGVGVALVGVATEEELEGAIRAVALPALDRDQLKALERFDLSRLDFVHPERWS